MEDHPTSAIEYVTLDLPRSNEDLDPDDMGVSVMPTNVTRSYNPVPMHDPETPSRSHPLTRSSLTHSTSQYQRKQQQQQQHVMMHGRGGMDVEYSTPASQQQQQRQQQQHRFDSSAGSRADPSSSSQQRQQQQHHSSSLRLNEVSTSSPHETGSGTVLLSSSSPNSVVSYANMPATNNNVVTTDQDSDTTQTRCVGSLKSSSSDVHTYSAQSFCQNEGLKKRALIHMQVNPLTHLDSLDKKELKLILKRIA